MSYTQKYLDDILVRIAYHSSGIEGNTITLPETVSIILEGTLPAGHKSIREFYEIENHRAAFDYILTLLDTKPLDVATICKIHARLTDRLQHDAGKLKTQQNAIIGAEFKTATPEPTPLLLRQWCDNTTYRLQNATTEADTIAALADTHIQLERIHPFSDGNGRTGRLLLMYLSMAYLGAPIIITKEHRAQYIENLAYQDITALANHFTQSLATERSRMKEFA